MRAINSVRIAAICALALLFAGVLTPLAHASVMVFGSGYAGSVAFDLPTTTSVGFSAAVVYEDVLVGWSLDPYRVSGDSLICDASDMNARATSGYYYGGYDLKTDSVSFILNANPGCGIEKFGFLEDGWFNLIGSDSAVQASLTPVLTILEVNGRSLQNAIVLSRGLTVNFDGLFPNGTQSAGAGISYGMMTTDWHASLEVNLAAALRANNIDGHVTKLSFSMQNSLLASVGNGIADIGVSQLTFNPGIAPVPEPGTWALMGLGAVGAVVMARRKRR